MKRKKDISFCFSRGFSLLEVSLAVSISGVLMGALWQISGLAERSLQANFVSSQLLVVSDAAQSYVTANRTSILSLAPALDDIIRIKVATADASGNTPSLQASGLLPSNFTNSGPYGQSYAFYVKREDAGIIGVADANDRLVGVVLTTGGQAVNDKIGALAVAKIGAAGGFMFSTDNPASPTAATTIRGAAGGWQINLSSGNWPSAVGSTATVGHLAAMTTLLPFGVSAANGGASAIDDLSDGKTLSTQVFLGSGTGDAATAGSGSTGTGYQALYTATSPNSASAFGYQSLYALTSGAQNSAFGAYALSSNTTSDGLDAFGYKAMSAGTSVYNVAVGSQAGQSSTSGGFSVAFGYNALGGVNVQHYNAAIGAQALEANTNGFNNVAVGYQALNHNTTPEYSTALGSRALSAMTTAGYSTAIGYNAAASLNTAGNLAVGSQALQNTTSGNQNTAVGFSAMLLNTTGSMNIAIGANAYSGSYLSTPTTGNNNIAIGSSTLRACTSESEVIGIGYAAGGQYNCGARSVALGAYALYQPVAGSLDDTTAVGYYAWSGGGTSTAAVGAETGHLSGARAGDYDAVLGHRAMYKAAGADYSVAIGHSALYSVSTGDNNSAVGYQAMYNTTTASNNTAIGYQALYSNTIASSQIAAGYRALYNSAPASANGYNAALGSQALYSLVSGRSNVAAGARAAYNVLASDNVALGTEALYSAVGSTALMNVAAGYRALYANTSPGGEGNVAIGYMALSANTKGAYNVAIGSNALSSNLTGSNNTAVGFNAGPTSSGLSNTTAIGYGATVSSSNEIRLGNTSVTTISGQVAWSFPSDRRDKHDIEDSDLGLDFLMHLRPVSYRLNNGNGRLDYGFVAQEVEAALGGRQTNMIQIRPDARGSYLFRANDMLSPIVKAMQERQKEIDDLKAEIAAVKAEIDALVPEKASAP